MLIGTGEMQSLRNLATDVVRTSSANLAEVGPMFVGFGSNVVDPEPSLVDPGTMLCSTCVDVAPDLVGFGTSLADFGPTFSMPGQARSIPGRALGRCRAKLGPKHGSIPGRVRSNVPKLGQLGHRPIWLTSAGHWLKCGRTRAAIGRIRARFRRRRPLPRPLPGHRCACSSPEQANTGRPEHALTVKNIFGGGQAVRGRCSFQI